MSNYTFRDKRELCYTDVSCFTDFASIGRDPLFKRFDSVNSVIHGKGKIPPCYWSFLAWPVYAESEDRIHWYVDSWIETPVLLNDLRGLERERYTSILGSTLKAYREANRNLDGDASMILCQILKTVDESFVYCYDGKVVLAVWGMVFNRNRHVTAGSVIHLVSKEKKKFKVTFDLGNHGSFKTRVDSVLQREEGQEIIKNDLPVVLVDHGYRLIGWSPSPYGFVVNSDMTFKAQYEPIASKKSTEEAKSTAKVHVTFRAGNHGRIDGEADIEVDQETVLSPGQIPPVRPEAGWKCLGWSPDIHQVLARDTVFSANYGPDLQQFIFEPGKHGRIEGPDTFNRPASYILRKVDYPTVIADKGYQFSKWSYSKAGNESRFVAQYRRIPWYQRFWAWLSSWNWKGCLEWLLIFLLLCLFLFLFFRSCRGCSGHRVVNGIVPIDTITTKDGRSLDDNGKVHDIVGDDGSLPVGNVVAPVLGDDGKRPPIIQRPGAPDIIANRLNLYFENDHVNLDAFAKDFKKAYPGDEYAIIGCDHLVKMIQIQIPESSRDRVRNELPSRLSSYKFFVVDESLFQLTGYSSATNTDAGWHLKAIHLSGAWKYTKGSPKVTVAVVDDGIDYGHPMFDGKIVHPYNVFTQSNTLSCGEGHGTHVAGLAAGSAVYYFKGVSGVAPGCKLMPVQVFDNQYATFSSVTSGIMYALHEGADVVNVSLGPEFKGLDALPETQQRQIAESEFKNEERVWREIISVANRKNAILVFAVGNDDILACIPPECRTDKTLNVAAVGRDYRATSFSNYGQGSNISAPGEAIYSAFPMNSFKSLDGTSMAAPIVSGAVALMKSMNRKLDVGRILRILRLTGRQVPGEIPPMVQLDKALALVKSGKIPASSPSDETGPVVSKDAGYAEIRRLIQVYKQKIKDLEKRLPEYKNKNK